MSKVESDRLTEQIDDKLLELSLAPDLVDTDSKFLPGEVAYVISQVLRAAPGCTEEQIRERGKITGFFPAGDSDKQEESTLSDQALQQTDADASKQAGPVVEETSTVEGTYTADGPRDASVDVEDQGAEHERVHQAALNFLQMRLNGIREVSPALEQELLKRARGIDPLFTDADLADAVKRFSNPRPAAQPKIKPQEFIREEEQTALDQLNTVPRAEKRAPTVVTEPKRNTEREERTMSKIPFVNIFARSDSYINSPRMNDETRKVHLILSELLWDEVMNASEGLSKKQIYNKVKKQAKISESNCSNMIYQVLTLLDFYSPDDDRRESAAKKLKAGSNTSSVLKKFYESDRIKTREALLSAKPGAGTERESSDSRADVETRQPAPVPIAPVMSNGTLAGAISSLTLQIEELTTKLRKLIDADDVLKSLKK